MSSSTLAAGLRRLRNKLAAQQRSAESDEQLLHDFTTRRDDSAFAILVYRHGPMVLHVCRRLLGHEQDAEDAFQATFLVLAQSAASLRNKTSLASFLHGTAYRTAMKAKRSAARRCKYEGQASSRPPTEPADELSWCEVRELLDAEIAGLPEIYRSVFVLCCLEELSQTEAGQRLGLKVRTVSNRLAEARKRLSQRLTRRGIELTAVLAASTLAVPTASALPAVLMAKTIEAALAMAAGDGLAGGVPPAITELVKGATMTAMANKTEIAAVLLLAAGLLAGTGAWTYRTLIQGQLTEPQAEAFEPDPQPRKTPWPHQNKAECNTVTGRVLDPDGKAKAGAKILLLDRSDNVKQVGVSAADGRFSVSIPKAAKERYLIAQAEGTGIDFVLLAGANPEALVDLRRTSLGVAYFPGANPEKPIELRLVKDHPIRGRIVNTEGQPITGVRVAVKILNVYADNSFQKAWKKHNFPSGIMPIGVKGLRPEAERGRATATAGLLLASMTDADGCFTLHGIGREWGALLRLSGAGIADKEVWIVNREGIDVKPYNAEMQKSIKGPAAEIYRLLAKHLELHDPNVPILAEPEKPICGVVTDADSGKGRPNVVVRLIVLERLDEKGRYPLTVPVQTTTDAEGRYEIRGALKAPSYLLEVPSDPSTGHVACRFRAGDTAGYEPLAANIRVKKGVIITGRIMDRASGRPVPGFARAHVLADNRFAKDYSELNSWSNAERQETSDDGTFRVVAIPGPVLLVGGPADHAEEKKYKPPSPDRANYPQYFPKEMKMSFHGLNNTIGIIEGNFCKVLEIKPGAGVIRQDIVLERRSFWERLLR